MRASIYAVARKNGIVWYLIFIKFIIHCVVFADVFRLAQIFFLVFTVYFDIEYCIANTTTTNPAIISVLEYLDHKVVKKILCKILLNVI